MDKGIEGLLVKLEAATAAEQDFEKTKLKVQLRHIMAIDNLTESIENLNNQLISSYQGDKNGSNG